MYFFRFVIPKMEDGTPVTYSPGYAGRMVQCPNRIVVDLYNDKEGFGIAHTDDTYIPPEVEVIKEEDALAIIQKAISGIVGDNPSVFISNDFALKANFVLAPEIDIAHRWDAKRDAVDSNPKVLICPKCHKSFFLPIRGKIMFKRLFINCPSGHKLECAQTPKGMKISLAKEQVSNGS